MTCIVGFIDQKTKTTWMGGDSACYYPKGEVRTTNQSKVFQSANSPYIILGSTTLFRIIDLLRYDKSIFDDIKSKEDADHIDHEYMVTKFIPKLIELFDQGIPSEVSTERNGTLMIGTPGKLFTVQSDFSVLDRQDSGIDAIGCGDSYALGSLFTQQVIENSINPHVKLVYALSAASEFSVGVLPPFHIISTDGARLRATTRDSSLEIYKNNHELTDG